MGHHTELGIFRRFSTLNFQNLLYLQAKLTHLEKDLKLLVQRDQIDPNRLFYSKDWWSLARSRSDPKKTQWKKVLQIRKTLREYNRQLAEQTYLLKSHSPKLYDLEFFRNWLERPNMGNFPLRGPDQDAWSSENTYDLVAIHRRESSDPFSRWLTDTFLPFFHNILWKRFRKPLPEDPESGICQYSETHLSNAVNILGTVLASILPIISIVALYFVTDTLVRLGMSVAFTALFSSCLAVMSRAKRVEIFAASSAFAAVQVVFVTGSNIVVSSSET